MDFANQIIDQACSNNAALLKNLAAYLGGTVLVSSALVNLRAYIAKVPGGPQVVSVLDKAALNFITKAAQQAAEQPKGQ